MRARGSSIRVSSTHGRDRVQGEALGRRCRGLAGSRASRRSRSTASRALRSSRSTCPRRSAPTGGARISPTVPMAATVWTSTSPAHAAAEPRPSIVFWHGGRWTSGDKVEYRFVGAALAELGYVTVMPNYRRYPEVKLRGFMEDAARAAALGRRACARSRRGRRAAVHHGAFGGSAHRGAAHPRLPLLRRDRAKCAAHRRPHRIVRPLRLLAAEGGRREGYVRSAGALCGLSTGEFRARDAPPALLIHGSKDRMVSPHELARASPRRCTHAAWRRRSGSMRTQVMPTRSPR